MRALSDSQREVLLTELGGLRKFCFSLTGNAPDADDLLQLTVERVLEKGMPEDAHAGLTGIDDEMSPGSISQLAQSNKVAFRVDFKNEPPKQSQLYWRGPVLWHTDGKKWTRGESDNLDATPLQSISDPVT